MNVAAWGHILGAALCTYLAWYFIKMQQRLSVMEDEDNVKDAEIHLAEALLVVVILVVGLGAAYGWIKGYNLLLRQGW